MANKLKITNQQALFGSCNFTPSNRKLFINKSRILSFIDKLKSEESLSSLKNSVFDLENNLHNLKNDKEGLLNITSNGDTVTISQKHLFNQLEQIIETQTLERAKYYVERFEKSLTQIKTSKINDINLNRWKEYDDLRTDSLWIIDKPPVCELN